MDLRSNDSRRFSQSSSSVPSPQQQQSSSSSSLSAVTGVKSKWIKAFRSLKLTAVGVGSRNNDLADLEAQRTYRISVQLGVHAFQEYTYKKITACDVCREILRGHSRQGLKCKLCKMNVHTGQCQENAPKCQPKPRLLRKQKSASELETKITIPQIDDEKYQNYDPVYQSLRAAADARKCAQYVTEHYSNYNGGGGSGGSGGGGGKHKHNNNYHHHYHHDSSGSGSSGSISIKQTYGNGPSNSGGGGGGGKHQDSNDSLVGSQTSLTHCQPQHHQHRQQETSSSSCPPPQQQQQQQPQPPPPTIKMTHRNSDSEFHQSTIEYHQQQYGSMMKQQQQQQQQPDIRYQHYGSGHSSMNNSNEQSPMITNRTLPGFAYHNNNGNGGGGIVPISINKSSVPIIHQQQQHHHNTPTLLTISQTQQQAYSAPHSPHKKKLTLRMKSLSLDSPESAETLKDKRPNFTPPIPPQLPPLPPIAAAHHYHHHHPHHHSQHRRDMMKTVAEPSSSSSSLPPTVGLVGQSPPRYDSNEMINHYSPYKSAAAAAATLSSQSSNVSIQHPTSATQQSSQQQQQQPSTVQAPPPPLPPPQPSSTSQQQQQTVAAAAAAASSNQYQISKRFKLGIHGRMRSFERDDQIFVQDLPPCSMSPCPSPKPQRLLPTNIFVVLYNFRSRQIDELNLRAGYMVTVVDTTDPDWWQGKCMGKVGFFPSKYVTKLFPGERPLQVIHTVQLTDGEFAIKLLREQIVIQVSEEMSGIIMVRTGINDKIVPCPSKYLQEITL
nr:protein kinase 4-like [Dermatophagoides farinae]